MIILFQHTAIVNMPQISAFYFFLLLYYFAVFLSVTTERYTSASDGIKLRRAYRFYFGDVLGGWKVDLEDGQTTSQRCLVFFQLSQLLFDAGDHLERLCTRDVARERTARPELFQQSSHLPLELLAG